jgi:hypothetical protein
MGLSAHCRPHIRNSGVTSIKSWAWIAGALLLVSFLVLILHLSATGEEFSRYNIGWNGTSDFFSELDRHTVTDTTGPTDLPPYTKATLLILAPDRTITAAEGARYRDFVARGNTLLLADDFGTGTSFLEAMGSTIRIRPGILSSVDRAYRDPTLAVAFPVKESPFLPAGSSLILDRAATLDGGEPLLATTVFSWVNETPNGNMTLGDVLRTYTVMAEEKIGTGTVYVLSDPSVFINGMTGQDHLFRNNIAKTPLLIDTYASRVVHTGGTAELIHSVRSNLEYKFLIAALLMAWILAAWHWRII